MGVVELMGMFDSDLVQQEATQLFQDYQNLMKLGGNYGKFDLKGKKIGRASCRDRVFAVV